MNNTQYIKKILSSVDRILVDTSTLMNPGFYQFVNNNRELLLVEGKRIIVPKSVYTELARHLQSEDEKKVYCVMNAIALLKNNEDIFQVVKSTLTDEEIATAFADPELLSDLTLNKQNYRQLLITNDQKLGIDAFDLNQQESCKGRKVYVCYITYFGELQRCECVRPVVESTSEKADQTQKIIPHEDIYSHKMTDEDRKQIDTALIKLGDYPIYIDDNSDTNPISMKSKLQQLASSGAAPKLVIVDYLQLMTMKSARARSRNEEVTDISRNLKLLAKDLNVPIIALSQLSRGAAKRDDHTPQLSDLRDSGAIEQDADTVMFVDRPDYYKKKEDGSTEEGYAQNGVEVRPAYIYLEKNRHGKTGRDSVWWIPSKTMFYEHNSWDAEELDKACSNSI